MHKLMNKYRHSFPAPVHEGSTTIWRLAQVLSWLQAKGGYALEEGLVELAQATMQVNLARDAASAAPLPADIVAMLRQYGFLLPEMLQIRRLAQANPFRTCRTVENTV